MPTFLWSGRSPKGEKEVDEVTAENALEARKLLEARGWTELRQYTTELQDFVKRQSEDSMPAAKRSTVTPKERLQYYEGTAPGLWLNWLKSIRGSSGVIFVLVACLLLTMFDQRMRNKGLAMGIILSPLVCLVLLYPVLRWWFRRTKRLFVKLHEARTWHRWNEMLACLEKLADSRQTTEIGIGEFAMARYRALALAGLGRLDEAMTEYCVAAEKAKTPQWLVHEFKAGIYTAAKKYELALECYRLALEAAVDKSMARLSLGMFLVQRFNRPGEASQLLAEVENAQLSELEQAFIPYLRGLIAFREKDFAAMDKNIRDTLARFEKRGSAKFYIFEGSILTCKGYLAVSSAALGRKQEAQRYFAQSKRYLELIDFKDLITQYEALAGMSR